MVRLPVLVGFDATDNNPTALDHDDLDGRVDSVERGR